jgi:hypothetical protein
MDPAQLALQHRCNDAADNGEKTNDALLGVCVAALVDGLEQGTERFSVCIEESTNSATALGDQGSYYECLVKDGSAFYIARHLPVYRKCFHGKMPDSWPTWYVTEYVIRAVKYLRDVDATA